MVKTDMLKIGQIKKSRPTGPKYSLRIKKYNSRAPTMSYGEIPQDWKTVIVTTVFNKKVSKANKSQKLLR